jgi:hypothetical protein
MDAIGLVMIESLTLLKALGKAIEGDIGNRF